MIKLNINNQQSIEISQEVVDGKINVDVLDPNGEVDYFYEIEAGELVMLLNYFQACKNGIEKSDYIYS